MRDAQFRGLMEEGHQPCDIYTDGGLPQIINLEAVIDGSEAVAFLALCHFMAVLRLGHFIQVDDMDSDHYLLKGILVNHSSYTSCDPGASHL